MRRARRPTPLELALWRHTVRDVQPLEEAPPEPARAAAAPPPPAGPPTSPGTEAGQPRGATRPVQVAETRPAPVPPPPRPAPGNLDRRTWQRLMRGLYPIAARLDLHGLSQAAAHRALQRFVEAEHGRGSRCLLVITGRGLRSGGVLKGETPRWLETPPLARLVLAYAAARTGHGGEGALYVLLRRRREG